MDKNINEYLNFRRTQITLQLQSITKELISIVELERKLSAASDLFDNNKDEIQITETEIIEIMRSKRGPWNTRKLIDASREKNQTLRGITFPMLGEQIIAIIQQNPIFKTVKAGYWELANES